MINVWLINCKLHFAQDWYSGDVKFIFQLWHWDLSREIFFHYLFHSMGPKCSRDHRILGVGVEVAIGLDEIPGSE